MTYTQDTQEFNTIANKLDAHYLELNNEGYDLAELEAIHVDGNTITLMFDPSYSDNLTISNFII